MKTSGIVARSAKCGTGPRLLLLQEVQNAALVLDFGSQSVPFLDSGSSLALVLESVPDNSNTCSPDLLDWFNADCAMLCSLLLVSNDLAIRAY